MPRRVLGCREHELTEAGSIPHDAAFEGAGFARTTTTRADVDVDTDATRS
jgi:hypothetical protein